MAKNVNKKSDKKKNNPPAKKSQGHKIVAEKGSVVVVANNLDDSNFVVGEKNLVNSKEQKVSKKSKSIKFSSKGEIPKVGDLPLGSHLPFSPNALFTGREKELKKLADSILGDSKTGTVITQAVTGMGGLGKTQLAVEFGYRYGKYFRGVHWINLADITQLDSEIANCGRQMFAQDFPEDQPSQVALTLQTWKTNGPNLLILDNFEEPSQANDVLTKLRHSNIHILVTSRRTDWSQNLGLSQLQLDLFSPEESLQFLKDSLKNRNDSDDDLENLAERLGYLPLGLELASRYLNAHSRLEISVYLEQTEKVLEHSSMQDWGKEMLGLTSTKHDIHLINTFALSWETINDETVQKIFMSAGYLAPNTSIPLEIFEEALEIEQEKCDEALNVVYGLGLFKTGEDKLPTIHPLLAEYARGLAKEDIKILESIANTLKSISFEALTSGLPSQFISIRSHIILTASFAENSKIETASNLWSHYGSHLHMIADYKGAKSAIERALKIDEANFGLDYPNVAIHLNNLGLVMKDLGDLNAAKAMYERALNIWEANLGTEHPQVAIGVNNLASVMQALGDLQTAKAMCERALKIDEANFGTDHPNMAIRLNNLGNVMKDLGDLQSAKELFERAIKIWEANLGAEHPKVATGVNNLGSVMKDLGDLQSAKELYERALKIDEANFGQDHPNVAIDVNNLAGVMKDLGDLQSAKAMFEHALKIREKSFGEEHPDIAQSLWWLGVIEQDEGNKEKAKDYFENALKIFQKFLPADHPRIQNLLGFLDSLDKTK